MDNQKDDINSINHEQKYGFQIVQPANGLGFNNNNNTNPPLENIVLSEAGLYTIANQKPSVVVDLSVWLYTSHIRLDDTTNKTLLIEIPLLELKRIASIWYRPGIVLKSKSNKYRVTWGNSEKINFLHNIHRIIKFIFKGDPRSKLWVSKTKELKKEAKKINKLKKS